MPATTFLLLVATVLSVHEGVATIDRGSHEGLRPGDVGAFYYELTVGQSAKRIELGSGTLIEADETRSQVEFADDLAVRPGHLLEFKIAVSSEVREELLSQARETQPPESEMDVAVRAVVLEWAAAWSDQRVDNYLAFYATSFRPPNGLRRDDWEILRRQRILGPAFIKVSLEQLEVVSVASRAAAATFVQTYRSDTYQDRVSKLLDFVREDGAWKIRDEREVE